MKHPTSNTTPALFKLWPVFILWLPMGRVFDLNSEHFGWGFFPFLFWVMLLPFMAPLSGIAALVELVRLRNQFPRNVWRPIVWAAISTAYWLTYAGLTPFAPQPIETEAVQGS